MLETEAPNVSDQLKITHYVNDEYIWQADIKNSSNTHLKCLDTSSQELVAWTQNGPVNAAIATPNALFATFTMDYPNYCFVKQDLSASQTEKEIHSVVVEPRLFAMELSQNVPRLLLREKCRPIEAQLQANNISYAFVPNEATIDVPPDEFDAFIENPDTFPEFQTKKTQCLYTINSKQASDDQLEWYKDNPVGIFGSKIQLTPPKFLNLSGSIDYTLHDLGNGYALLVVNASDPAPAHSFLHPGEQPQLCKFFIWDVEQAWLYAQFSNLMRDIGAYIALRAVSNPPARDFLNGPTSIHLHPLITKLKRLFHAPRIRTTEDNKKQYKQVLELFGNPEIHAHLPSHRPHKQSRKNMAEPLDTLFFKLRF